MLREERRGEKRSGGEERLGEGDRRREEKERPVRGEGRGEQQRGVGREGR